MKHQEIHHKIEEAAHFIGKTWPLYAFVTGNQLSGYENMPFFDALTEGGELWNAKVLPSISVFQKAWEDGKINRIEIKRLLINNGFNESPEYYLDELKQVHAQENIDEWHELNRLMVKWLSMFMDEGMAAWSMPFKDRGFFMAWSLLVPYDDEINGYLGGAIPKTPEEVLERVLDNFEEKEHLSILKYHLAALPGWAGFIKYRVENDSDWNQNYTINLLEYLAVRLWIARCLKLPILPTKKVQKNRTNLSLKYLWLEAWEQTWQHTLFDKLKGNENKIEAENKQKPEAQLVFCLDTRSELLRRQIEQIGNYETFGAAGAFGVLMNYQHPETGLINKSSPAMLPSQYLAVEVTVEGKQQKVDNYKKKGKRFSAYKYFMGRLKNILPSAFGYVESAGIFYGIMMVLRLVKPNLSEKIALHHQKGYEAILNPKLYPLTHHNQYGKEIPINDKVEILKGFFLSCGWKNFAPLVVLSGHASHSVNNPYASSLDCGACSGNPGKRNARVLAQLANDKALRDVLEERYGIEIPDDTFFIAAEHITSSDEVELFDDIIPKSHKKIVNQLKEDLLLAKAQMIKERLNEPIDASKLAKIKSNSWSESRPEWGLSGHAGYIIGSRSLTINGIFSDCFLSSYDWQMDKDGSILKGILQGPLLVCQWISNHYYFSTVDNDVFGAGSKITHNVTGKFGVMQGNGSDLKIGLPLQSLMYSDEDNFHNPIRLTTLVQAPKKWVAEILKEDEKLSTLVKNNWIYLFVMDPQNKNHIERVLF